MQIANILLSLGGDHGNTINKFAVTASEIVVLRAIHGEDSVKEVEPLGEIKRSHRAERERLLATYGGAKKDERPVVENLFPGVAARLFEELNEIDLPEEFFKSTQRATADDVGKPAWDAGLRKDGPTIAEWLDAGYLAEAYPPTGYEAKNTPEEVEAEVKARASQGAQQPAASQEADEDADDAIGEINDEHADNGKGDDNVLG